MSTSADEEPSRKFLAPYTPKNPIPTIKSYRKEQKERQEAEVNPEAPDERTRKEKAHDAYSSWKDGEAPDRDGSNEVYPTDNFNSNSDGEHEDNEADVTDDLDEEEATKQAFQDTSELKDAGQDAKAKRKSMKKRKDRGGVREVTDPVTHLPIKIHDFTGKDLENVPENFAAPAGFDTEPSEEQLLEDAKTQQRIHTGMGKLFPTPDLEAVGSQLARVQSRAMTFGLCIVLLTMIGILIIERVTNLGAMLESRSLGRESAGKSLSSIFILVSGTAIGALAIYIVHTWTEARVKDIWSRHLWEAERQKGKEEAHGETPESTEWLCGLLSSVWPLVNPDLFISLADMLEDVMQASLPRLVRMISVEDIGQGSESFRILGVRWLPSGAAAQSVTEGGKLSKPSKKEAGKSDRSVPGEGQVKNSEESKNDADFESKDDSKDESQEDEQLAEGLEAEEGDFINLEVAFSYRARSEDKSMRKRLKSAHLYLAFYLPGNIKFPVWVELEGMVGVMRLRMQLCPDPPFFSLCTLTFLGQPKVDLSCVPLSKRGLNIMDVPVISNFVQSAVDAAVAEYVAPKSLTLDLKELLAGEDFKKDTSARGVLLVKIRRAFDFKEGDAGIGPFSKGSTDGYVSVGWAKFGKPVWSTRVIKKEMHPSWEESTYVLVTAEELNVGERLRLQLWDSDRMTADDDLGRIEVDLKELMNDKRSKNHMWEREDGFRALKAGEQMPGRLAWSVGYFAKTNVLPEQLPEMENDPDVKTIDDLKRKVDAESERKLREAKKDESREIAQLKAQDWKEKQDEIINATPPPNDFPSGVLSIVIHQITGLELEAINKKETSKHEAGADEEEEGDDLPSAYCTIILNHQKVFRTRTKPKNGKPFYNAGCERFLRDWRNAEILISVRDARVHEDDALIGIIMLPLKDVFKNRSQVDGIWPLSGGIGYGKARISMVFRSLQIQAPKELLGWEYGTLDIKPEVKVSSDDGALDGLKLKARTSLGSGKFYGGGGETWKRKNGQPLRLAVKKRYSSPLVLEFRTHHSLTNSTPAFAILWLKDICDNEDITLRLPVWKGDMARAEANVLEKCGEKVGEVEISFKFWSGLSGYHTPLAKQNANIGDVMEVLDCAHDNEDQDESPMDESYDSDSSTNTRTSEADGGGDDDEDGLERRKTFFAESKKDSHLEEDGKRGTLEQIDDYKAHRKELHRHNRGLMQWKAPRTVEWVGKKVTRAEQRVVGLFRHHSSDQGIEREV